MSTANPAPATAATAAVSPQTDSRLVQVPLEVLIRIIYHVSTVDFCNVRLSCRALERALFLTFSHEFFRKKQFMATTASLQALIGISKHPTLSPCLKHVIISCDRPSNNTWVRDSDRTDEARAALELALADHMHLLVTGGLRDMLAEAFANLANLEVVDIRNFNSRSRNRDGLGAEWRSYGAVTLAAATGAPVSAGPWTELDPYPTQLFSAVTAALAIAQARPKSLEVLVRNRSRRPFALHDAAFYISPHAEESMSPFLAGLRWLHLSLSLSHHPRTSRMSPFMLQKFLSLAPNLTWLRLNFSNGERQDAESLFSWLAMDETQRPGAPFGTGPIQLRHLERLDIGDVELEPQTLVKTVAKFAPTLTSLYVRRVCLYDDENHARSPRVNPWRVFLTAILRIPGLKLKVLDFSSLTTASPDWRVSVKFDQPDVPWKAFDYRCSANMATMDKAISEAIEAMVVDWPPEPGVNDATDADNDESDEDVLVA